MKTAAAFVVLLIAFGTASLWWGTTRAAVENNEPVRLAYPGPGFTSIESFHLPTSGRFALQVATPATAQELTQLHREQPDVPCDVEVTLRRDNRLIITRRISSFHNGGWEEENLFFPDELFVLPRGGDYELQIHSNGGGEVFTRRGAIVTLERWEDVGSAIGWALAIGIGYASLACAIVVSFAVARGYGAASPNPNGLKIRN